MPVIFAASILSAPMMLSRTDTVQNSSFLRPIFDALMPGYPWYEFLYMLGIIFFALDRLRYFHALWHLFVLAGSISHYFGILFYVLPARP